MSKLSKMNFGNETGDDAPIEELRTYYVKQDHLDGFFRKEEKIKIYLAKKGGGKSSLIEWGANELRNKQAGIVIKLKGSDLRIKSSEFNSADLANDMIEKWKIKICTQVNRAIAKEINVAFTDDKISILEAAEIEGFREKNLIGCLMGRFHRVKKETQSEGIKSEVEIAKRTSEESRVAWILIDDLDATFQNTELEKKMLGTFFSACRYLSKELKGIAFRITMRTDVFPLVRRFDEAMDKVEQYVVNLEWSADDFQKLLAYRVLYSFPELNKEQTLNKHEMDKLISSIFVPKMLWKDKDQYTYKVIHTLSYHRPRWAIQLCKLATKSAIQAHRDHISKDDIDSVWAEYGKKKIADIVAEHKHQCAEIEEIINAFRNSERRLNRNELFSLIKNKVTNHITTNIEGKTIKNQLDIAHFLFRIGFLVARHNDEQYDYTHYSYDQMPDFLASRTDEDHGVVWEIHPAFREALDIVKLNRAQRERVGMIQNIKGKHR